MNDRINIKRIHLRRRPIIWLTDHALMFCRWPNTGVCFIHVCVFSLSLIWLSSSVSLVLYWYHKTIYARTWWPQTGLSSIHRQDSGGRANMYMYVHVCAHVYVYMYVFVHVYAYTYANSHNRMHLCLCICILFCMEGIWEHEKMSICTDCRINDNFERIASWVVSVHDLRRSKTRLARIVR